MQYNTQLGYNPLSISSLKSSKLVQRSGQWTQLDKMYASTISEKTTQLLEPRIDNPLCEQDKSTLQYELTRYLSWLNQRIEKALKDQATNAPITEGTMSHESIVELLTLLKEGAEEALQDAIARVQKT